MRDDPRSTAIATARTPAGAVVAAMALRGSMDAAVRFAAALRLRRVAPHRSAFAQQGLVKKFDGAKNGERRNVHVRSFPRFKAESRPELDRAEGSRLPHEQEIVLVYRAARPT